MLGGKQVAQGCSARRQTSRIAFQPALPNVSRRVVAAASSSQDGVPGVSRRDALAQQLVLMAGILAPQQAFAEEAVAVASAAKLKELYDPILAYRYLYPTETASGKPLSMIIARTPEKYSSAAPLNADARQRIVSEVVDFKNFVTVSMTVGPASGVLKGVEPAQWRDKDVGLTVLIDRSTARVSTGQRVALNDIEEVHKESREGLDYWVYEHTSQGSPTIRTRERETFRHALAVTTYRAGLDGTPYLYTLNMACPQEIWDDMEPVFRASIASFALKQTTRDYIPPDKDPWLFF